MKKIIWQNQIKYTPNNIITKDMNNLTRYDLPKRIMIILVMKTLIKNKKEKRTENANAIPWARENYRARARADSQMNT